MSISARRCGECGAHLELSPDGTRLLLVGQRCARCGQDNEAGLAFCGYCGERLNVQCRRCGSSNLAERDHCAVCGAPLAGMDELALTGDWHDHTVLVNRDDVPDMVAVQARSGWELEATTTPIRTGQEKEGAPRVVVLHFRRRTATASPAAPPQDYRAQQMAEETALQGQLRRSSFLGRLAVVVAILLGTLLAYYLFSDISRIMVLVPGF
ncbi:MAG: zinc ribbon domain-containing protein [Anaerolineae bacterium]|nr:zinc ribbon domain-containing protein [Anaerolineae bacterium]